MDLHTKGDSYRYSLMLKRLDLNSALIQFASHSPIRSHTEGWSYHTRKLADYPGAVGVFNVLHSTSTCGQEETELKLPFPSLRLVNDPFCCCSANNMSRHTYHQGYALFIFHLLNNKHELLKNVYMLCSQQFYFLEIFSYLLFLYNFLTAVVTLLIYINMNF